MTKKYKQKKITLKQMAQYLGISAQAVWMWSEEKKHEELAKYKALVESGKAEDLRN